MIDVMSISRDCVRTGLTPSFEFGSAFCRFVVVIFPAFWVIARAVERRRLPESVVTGTFAAGYGILALLFVNWWHVF